MVVEMSREARFVLFSWSLLIGLCLPHSARAEMRIAVVDTQWCVMQTEDGARAQSTLKKFFYSRQSASIGCQLHLGTHVLHVTYVDCKRSHAEQQRQQ